MITGQAGHEVVPDEQSNVLRGQEHLFNLEGQLQHKLELINKYIDKQSKIHLIGHSIGAWLILQLLQANENVSMRVSSINLLFPTLQEMANTKNGRFLNTFIRNFHKLFLFLFHLAYLLPDSIKAFIVKIYLNYNSLPLHYSKCINTFLNPRVGEKVLFLAYDEMDTVKSLNIEVIDKMKHLINIIYSDKDNWAPISYMEDLQKYRPQIQMQEVHIDHAFVFKSSERVAEMVTQFINKNCNKL